MPLSIEDYALIGDCETAALVARDGSIDWLCWPRFDSDACFSALLGGAEHGRWRIAPDTEAAVSRRYRGESLILETSFETASGAVRLIDFMPPRRKNSDIVRIVEGVRGAVAMQSALKVRFGYGREAPWISRLDNGALKAVAGPDMVLLQTPIRVEMAEGEAIGAFDIAAGETRAFVLTYGASHLPAPEAVDADAALKQTEAFWQDWSAKSLAPEGRWREAVMRSLITLKALTYAPTGGIVAAPTTSLPEQIGGQRNWDYRYCWLRDATLTLLSLMSAGYYDEAKAWRDWLVRVAAGSPRQLQILYGVAGERRITEWEADWLPGYEQSRPVRIGNAAHRQLQLDVFGEVMDALHQARRGGLARAQSAWTLQREMLAHLETTWREPDQGIWETRGGKRHFTFSKAMAWVAFDRGVKAAEEFGLDAPIEAWARTRDRIHSDICENAFDPALNSFVQNYGARHVDASLLLLATMGFLSIDDARIVGTVGAIERTLLVDGLVRRYDTTIADDGLPAGEGAFLACSFWLADVYAMMGRFTEARALFERLLALRNDVGLLSEEYDPAAQRLVGNFPQAFSHVALINTALNLSHANGPARQRSAPGPS